MKKETNSHPIKRKRIAVMGSTGSIGCQTLDIIEHYPELYRAEVLTANRNWEKLARQALQFRPSMVVIADERFHAPLAETLRSTGIRVLAGDESLKVAATLPEVDIVIGALVGYSGLPSSIEALEEGKTLALANKETLVVGGEIIEKIVQHRGKRILPVDSEHSAIFQCLWGEDPQSVSKIILTASGGPFRKYTRDQLQHVTVGQALAHPNWDMGAKVTIDSATMMNKGFEMIEARWLFSKSPSDIEVVVHPESIVHSMVEFIDGSVKAQMGLPDMRLPIEVAISYPRRINLRDRLNSPRLNLMNMAALTFEKPDMDKFPLLKLAYEVAQTGGLVPALMNAANEVAVRYFLERKIGFTQISRLVIKVVEDSSHQFNDLPVTLENIAHTHKEGTEIALRTVNNID